MQLKKKQQKRTKIPWTQRGFPLDDQIENFKGRFENLIRGDGGGGGVV